jgi:preprotein translocase subunit SecG
MFTFILVVQAIVAALLVTVILMQKSEGGGLGVGGSPAGLMSARGAADFLTRSTTVLAVIFVSLSIVLAVIASIQHRPSDIDTSLVKQAPAAPAGPAGPVPATGNADPLAGAAGAAGDDAADGNVNGGAVPLAN